ncbi:hypothetical protein, partial [Bacillus cereus]|uniref:hypothetical protein n=1 Tax=Bacillus cereus TaxID=1396 RepID=UPI00381CCA01
MQKEQFLKLSQGQKEQYLLELRRKMGKDSQSNENPASLMYPVIQKEEEQKLELFPLTDIQESFLVGKYYGAEKDKVGCHVYCEFEESRLDIQRFKDTWHQLIVHHSMLHTMIYADGQQRVMEEIPNYEIPVHDLQKS